MAVARSQLTCLVLVVLLAACGGGTAGEPTDQGPKGLDPTETPSEAAEAPAEQPSQEPASEAAAPADLPSTADVIAEGFAFAPATTEVAAGGMVTWTNEDGAGHTVSAGAPDAPELDVFSQPLPADGGTVTRTFDEPGTYPYFCNIHASMTGEVVVR